LIGGDSLDCFWYLDGAGFGGGDGGAGLVDRHILITSVVSSCFELKETTK
jgi:hypothetical protein